MIQLPKDPQRILLIKPSAIGDVVHALPILNLLRRRWPGAKISWLITPGCAGLLDGHPQLDEVILFERHRLAAGWRDLGALRDLSELTRDLRRRKFDLVIDLQGLLRSGWLTYQTGAPVRVGFSNAREFAWVAYTHRVKVGTTEQHALERYLAVAEEIGCGRGPVEFVFATDDADRAFAANLLAPFLNGVERFALLFPGTNWPTKRWPVQNFAAIVPFIEQKLGLPVFIGGGPGEVKLATQLLAGVPDSAEMNSIDRSVTNLAGKTNLRQLTALIERASLVISNDSGPMHLAAALNRPMVALFGPTNPIRTGPYGHANSVVRLDIPCSPCYSRRCSHQSCLKWLTTDSVMSAAEEALNESHASSPLPAVESPAP